MGKAANVKTAAKALSGSEALLGMSTVVVKKTATKSDDKKTIIAEEKVALAIDSYCENKIAVDQATKKMKAAEAIIKPAVKKYYIEHIEKHDQKMESFVLASAKNGVLGIAMDDYPYANLNDEKGQDRVEYLKETYGEDIITTKNTFVLNEELVDKYGALLMDFIKNNKNIEDEDRMQIIQVVKKHTITKGTINNIAKIAKEAKVSTTIVWDEVSPKQQLKVRGAE